MKLKLGLISLTLGLVAAPQAQSEVISAISDTLNTGGSELLLTVFNNTDNTSYTRDLGVTFNQLLDGSSLSPLTADSTLSGLDLNDTNFQWSVVAADGVVRGDNVDPSTHGSRVLTTINGTPATISNNDLEGSTTAATSWINGMQIKGTHPTQTNGSSVTNDLADGSTWITWMHPFWKPNSGGSGGTIALGTAAAPVGTSMDFWLGTETIAAVDGRSGTNLIAQPGDPAIFTQLGTFSLDTAGTLSYQTSAVPVPAAVWLFGSGLVGLVGVARKKRA